MKVKVLYFAQVAEKIGIPKEEVWLEDGSNTEDLFNLLIQTHPELKDLKYKVAVDQLLVRAIADLENGSEVALLPPFAGG